MEILVIGKEEIKNYIKENINTDNDNFLIPKEINEDILLKILEKKDFDYVIFSLEEVITVDNIRKHLISYLKKYGSPKKFFIVDKKERLSSTSNQLEKMATIVKNYDKISFWNKKENDFENIDDLINGEDLDFENLVGINEEAEKEIPISAIDDILNPVSKNNQAEVIPSTPIPSQEEDIFSILGINREIPPATNNNIDDILGISSSENSIDDILNITPKIPVEPPKDDIATILGSDMVPATVAPLNTQSPMHLITDDDIPDVNDNADGSGLSKLIKTIMGPGKMGANQLPSIPEEVLPDNLKRPYILTFWASKGGTGKTTVALNTCAYISSLSNLRVILVDVDEFGDTGLSMGMSSSSNAALPTIDDFINHMSSMKSFEDVSPFVVKEISTNLHILLTSENSSNAQKPTKTDYQNVIKILQQHFDIIAFDCGDKLYDDYTILAIGKADFIIMVVDQGFPTLSHMSKIVTEFSQPESGIGKDKLIMVVNKYQKNVGMNINEIGSWFESGISSIHAIPALFFESMKTLNQGELIILTHNTEVKQAYNRIVSDILRKIKMHQTLNK